MAKQVKLAAERRDTTGRAAMRKLKGRGIIPAIVYGGKDKPQPLQVSWNRSATRDPSCICISTAWRGVSSLEGANFRKGVERPIPGSSAIPTGVQYPPSSQLR